MDVLGFGVGGAVGAALTVLVAGTRLSASWQVLREAYKAYMSNKTDPDSIALNEAFQAHESAVASLTESFTKLKRSLRIR